MFYETEEVLLCVACIGRRDGVVIRVRCEQQAHTKESETYRYLELLLLSVIEGYVAKRVLTVDHACPCLDQGQTWA
jgi:hypothetical protein